MHFHQHFIPRRRGDTKNPQHDKFSALLRPDENGQLQLYYDTLESNLDDYFFVLRFLGEEGDVPQP